MTRRLGTCLLGLVLLVVAASSVGALGVPTAAQTDAGPQPQTTPEGYEDTVFQITVYENASARWTIQHSRPLENETEIDRFRRFAAEFRDRETSTYTDFQSGADSLVSAGQDETGRSMNATGFTKNASVVEFGQDRGVVKMSFVWTNFGQREGDDVAMGDVFSGGMYLGDTQRLVIRPGPSLAFADVQPTPDSMASPGDLAASESVTWVGEVRFNDQRPYAEFAPHQQVEEGGGADGASGGGDGADGGNGAGGDDAMTPMLLAGGLLLVAIAGGLAWYTGRLPPGGTPGPVTSRRSAGEDAGEANTQTSAGGGGGAAAAATQVQEADLLSDEDRVLQLLDENGGRMKQVAIVEETDWSKSKVSMLLSDMEEDGDISKLRLGRENIISLAGQEPDAAGSPFEDE